MLVSQKNKNDFYNLDFKSLAQIKNTECQN